MKPAGFGVDKGRLGPTMGGTEATAQTLNVQSWVVDGSRLQVVAENQCPRVRHPQESSKTCHLNMLNMNISRGS